MKNKSQKKHWQMHRIRHGENVSLSIALYNSKEYPIDEYWPGGENRVPPKLREKPLVFVLRSLKMEQQELAEKIQADSSVISCICRGRNPRMITVQKIAVSLNWITSDIVKLITAEPAKITLSKFKTAIADAEGSLNEKAKKLNIARRTLGRWLDGKSPIPAGVAEDIERLGWSNAENLSAKIMTSDRIKKPILKIEKSYEMDKILNELIDEWVDEISREDEMDS